MSVTPPDGVYFQTRENSHGVGFDTQHNPPKKATPRAKATGSHNLILFNNAVYRLEVPDRKLSAKEWKILREQHILKLTQMIKELAQNDPRVANATRFHYQGNQLHFATDGNSPTQTLPVPGNRQRSLAPLTSFIQKTPSRTTPPTERATPDTVYRKLARIGGIETPLHDEDMPHCWAALNKKYPHFEALSKSDESDTEIVQKIIERIKPKNKKEMSNRLFLLPIRLKKGKTALLFIDFRGQGKITYFAPAGSAIAHSIKSQMNQLTQRLQRHPHFAQKSFTLTEHFVRRFDPFLSQLYLTQHLIDNPDPDQAKNQLQRATIPILEAFRKQLSEVFRFTPPPPKTSFLGKLTALFKKK